MLLPPVSSKITRMAKVFLPLYSMSASGSVGGTVCYHPVADQPAREIRRAINGREVVAQYPPRIVTGRGYVRMKPQRRPELARRKRGRRGRLAYNLFSAQVAFPIANHIANWVIKNNIAIFSGNSPEGHDIFQPWTLRRFALRGETREQRKFPGQQRNRTVSIRTDVTVPLNKREFIVHSIIGHDTMRWRNLLLSWNKLTNQQQEEWNELFTFTTEHIAPYRFPTGGNPFPRGIMYAGIVNAFLLGFFSAVGPIFTQATNHAAYRSPRTEADYPLVIAAWERHLASTNDNRAETTTPWG